MSRYTVRDIEEASRLSLAGYHVYSISMAASDGEIVEKWYISTICLND